MVEYIIAGSIFFATVFFEWFTDRSENKRASHNIEPENFSENISR